MFCRKCPSRRILLNRLYSSKAVLSSTTIRNQFLDYFIHEKNHSFVRSCPLKPISDPTIPFVNAGMVQFKSVLQGKSLPPAPNVANSQKCARVGGKHNDLSAVGLDGYHHTFFEMLGNWSFGNADKFEACQMAWELLIGAYGLKPGQLYVTYFGGDKTMSLEADIETKDIWRQLGAQESHILPFGAKENFWEMGLVGPCGPCTEVHVDHIPGRLNAGKRVNAGFSDLTELWNIVFIQYNRNDNGSLDELEQSHVDTGMGFERLVALLNGAKSNYDTDLFLPLMEAIHKISGLPAYSSSFDQNNSSFSRDQAYRILCDHSRLLTVALADNVIPDKECKLKWIMRRSLDIAQNVMQQDEKLILELSNHVAESLYNAYPEIGKNLSKVQRIILDEAKAYNAIKLDFPKPWMSLLRENPEVEKLLVFGSNRQALASAYRKIMATKDSHITPALAFQLYESDGISVDLINEMAKLSGKSFSPAEFEKEHDRVKMKSKQATASKDSSNGIHHLLSSSKIAKTYDNLKYDYDIQDSGYTIPPVSAKVVGLLLEGELRKLVPDGSDCGVILDRTNFYSSAGGQACDQGYILVKSSDKEYSLSVKEVTKLGDYVVHFGHVTGSIQVGDEVMTRVDQTKRIACMKNHTLAHLLNGEMQRLFDAPVQLSCDIQPDIMKIHYILYGEEFTADDAKKLEENISHTIEEELPVYRYTVNTWQIPPSTTLVPDETYPIENIHIIDIKKGKKIVSREACCGTHVLNTKHIGNFCVVGVIIKSKKMYITAVTGHDAAEIELNSENLTAQVGKFSENVLDEEESITTLREGFPNTSDALLFKDHLNEIQRIHTEHTKILRYIERKKRRFTYVKYCAAATALDIGLTKIQKMARILSEFEVRQKALNSPLVVHALTLSNILEKTPLSKYTRLSDVPIMLMALRGNELKVRCFIPKAAVSEDFNALAWMKETLSSLVISDSDANVSSVIVDSQTVSVQSRTIEYKKGVSSHVRRERLCNAKETAYKWAESKLKKAE